MADSKISALTAQTTVAVDDMFPVATAAGATKKITGANLAQTIRSRDQVRRTAWGIISENYPFQLHASVSILTAQQISGQLVGVLAGDVITNCHIATSTKGTGAGYARMALYSTSGTQLAVSNDANSLFVGTEGTLTVPLSAPYTVTSTGGVYVCVLTDLASTQPTFWRAPTFGGGNPSGIGAGVPLSVRQNSQASFPTPATLVSTGTQVSHWVGIS